MNWRRLRGIMLFGALSNVGCGAPELNQTPTKSASTYSDTMTERTVGPTVAEATAEDDAIVIKVAAPILCRNLRTWKPCGSVPAVAVDVVVILGDDRQLLGRTDPTGVARISLAGLKPSTAVIREPHASVRIAQSVIAVVDISALPVFATWKTAIANEEAAYEARLQQARAERDAESLDQLRQSARKKLATLRSIDEQLAALGPPWTPTKTERVVRAIEALKLVAPTVEELENISDGERQEFMQSGQRVKTWMDRQMPGLVDAASAAQKAHAAAIAKEAESPAAIEARREAAARERTKKCEALCSDGRWKCSQSCDSLDFKCNRRCDSIKATCEAGCQ